MSRAKGMRRVRAGQGAIVLFEIGGAVFETLRGHVAGVLILAACAVAVTLAMLWLTGKIRQREHLDRPRPDYSLIAAMELEVYGQAFRHDGAPEAVKKRPVRYVKPPVGPAVCDCRQCRERPHWRIP